MADRKITFNYHPYIPHACIPAENACGGKGSGEANRRLRKNAAYPRTKHHADRFATYVDKQANIHGSGV